MLQKNIKILFLIVASILVFTSCLNKKGCTDPDAYNYDSYAEKDDGSCYYSPGCMDNAANNYSYEADYDDGSCYYEYGEFVGKLIVFRYGECWEGNVDIFINDTLYGTLNDYYQTFPDCDATGDLISFVTDYGEKDFRAVSTNGTEWEGVVNVPRNTCVHVQLKCDGFIDGNAYLNDEETGEILIWTSEDFGGDIAVTINNDSAGIIRTIYDTIPEGGESGCVTKCNLTPGTYNIHAEYGTYIWESFSIQVFGGKCSKFELR